MSMFSKEEGFFFYLKRILNDVQINFESAITPQVNIDMRNEDHVNKTFEKDESANAKDNKDDQDRTSVRSERANSISSSSSYSSHDSQNEKYIGDKMRSQLNKLKIAESEYQIGRIEYRSPSAIRLSHYGSRASLESQNANANENENESSDSPVLFYVKQRSPTSEDDQEKSDEGKIDIYLGKTDSSGRNHPHSRHEVCSLDIVQEESSVNLNSNTNFRDKNQ